MALRISKKTTFEILMNHQENGSLTPAVRGDYAKHNCPLDQYVRLAADAMMVELRIVSNVLLDASIFAGDGLFEKLNNYQDATDP